jgi:hypothetical protein
MKQGPETNTPLFMKTLEQIVREAYFDHKVARENNRALVATVWVMQLEDIHLLRNHYLMQNLDQVPDFILAYTLSVLASEQAILKIKRKIEKEL